MRSIAAINGQLLANETMAHYTSWRVGGVADWMYLPKNKADLVAFIQQCPEDKALFWLGLGSNLLVRDGGIRGLVINTRGRLKAMQLTENSKVYVEAGVACAHVARFCAQRGLAGAEFLAGIPGTMGGALKMNAGAFGSETWTLVESVEMINRKGEVIQRSPKEFDISYRSVKGTADEWFLAAELKLTAGVSVESQRQIKSLLEKRNLSQPINQPSCGSVFKNPPSDYAARLIELSGLKGYTIGGAKVSEKHANFIVNLGTATAADIEQLIHYVQTQVNSQQGVYLQTEVCKVGEA
jgi:UDP-N-acetylmuramate dehydrogenase